MSIFSKYGVVFVCLSLSISVFASSNLSQAKEKDRIETDRQMLKRAQKELKKGEPLSSETTLRTLAARSPKYFDAKLLLSYVLLKQKKYLESYEIALSVVKENNRSARGLALLGFSYLSTGNFEEARLNFGAAYTIDRNESLAWEGAGLLDFYENNLPRSIFRLREAVFLDGEEPDFFYTLAQVEARSENYNEAAAAYRSFLRIAPPNDVSRRDKIKGLIGFLEFLGSRSSLYEINGTKQTTVPIEIVNQRPILKIKIGRDSKEYRFVLDTGSSVTVLSEKTAKAIGIKPVASGGQASAIGGTGKFNIVYGFLNSIGIGDCKIRNVPIYIRRFHEDAENVDGFIGLAVISRFLTTLDYKNSSLTLVKSDKNEVQKVFAENDLAIPLKLTTSGFLTGEVRIQGLDLPYYFIVDTGASISVISTDLARNTEIGKFATDEKIRVVGAGGVLNEVPSYILPKISFGSNSSADVSAVALDLNIINENSGFIQAGILGGNVLQKYRLTFDFKGSKIAFFPNAQ